MKLPPIRLAFVVALLAVVAALGGGWLWLRHSSLLGAQRPTTVVHHVPVAALISAGGRMVAAGDGALLRAAADSNMLPSIFLPALPRGARVSDPHTLAVLRILAAAPPQLLEHVGRGMDGAAHGVVIDLRNGPSLYFGEPDLERAKWTAAADVLADPGSRGAAYIDLSNPRRPAAG